GRSRVRIVGDARRRSGDLRPSSGRSEFPLQLIALGLGRASPAQDNVCRGDRDQLQGGNRRNLWNRTGRGREGHCPVWLELTIPHVPSRWVGARGTQFIQICPRWGIKGIFGGRLDRPLKISLQIARESNQNAVG